MVKSIFPILIILIVLCSCSKKENNAENKSLDSAKKEKVTTYTYKDGKAIDSAVVEIADGKAKIVNYKYIDNVLYVIYIQYIVTIDKDKVTTMNYDSHYLSTCKQLSFKIGDVVDIGKIETNDEPFDIEQPCSEDDSISIKKLDIINDGSTYLYLVRPDCSDYKTHIVLKKVGNKYEKLFELECFDLDLDFKLIDNSVITAIYKISYNYDKPIKKVFKYNLKK